LKPIVLIDVPAAAVLRSSLKLGGRVVRGSEIDRQPQHPQKNCKILAETTIGEWKWERHG